MSESMPAAPQGAARAPLPVAVRVVAAALAIESLVLVALAVRQVMHPIDPAQEGMRLKLIARCVLAAIHVVLAAGLWGHRRRAWIWATGLAALRLGCFVAYPLMASRYLPDGKAAGLWLEALPYQIVPLLTVVLLMLPQSRRAFSAGSPRSPA